jgi:hypothetical protein
MRLSKEHLNGNLRPDELEAHRLDLAQKASLLATMPTLKEIEENWWLYLKWQSDVEADGSPRSFHDAFDEGNVIADLSGFFYFWVSVQRYYLQVLTFGEGMTMEGVVDGSSRPMDCS